MLPPARVAVVLAVLAAVLAGLSSHGAALAKASRQERNRAGYLQWQRWQRYFIVHEPPRIDPEKPLPVVIMLHGYCGTAEWSLNLSGWAEKADEEGFLALFPEGTRPDHSRPMNTVDNCPAWNDGSGRFTACWENVDDVGFLCAMLDEVAKKYPVDRSRVYVTGFSNGSSLAYRAALEAPGRFAAVGAMSSSGIRVPLLPLMRPVSLIALHGTADGMSPLQGGIIPQFGKIDVRPPVIAAPQAWAMLLGLSQWETIETETITLHRARSQNGDAEVRYYVLQGCPHTWPRSRTVRSGGIQQHDQFDVTDVMWDFFESVGR